MPTHSTDIDWRDRPHAVLSDLYNADRHAIAEAQRDGAAPVWPQLAVNRRTSIKAPHPLIGVQYADGVIPDTTAGSIHTRNR